MGYYMRYITLTPVIITLQDLESALRLTHQNYVVTPDQINDLAGDLFWGDTLLGEVEINRPNDGIFEEDIGDLKELVQHSTDPKRRHILEMLNQATSIIAVRALWKGHDADTVLSRLDPLWDWLFMIHPGLLQADNDGFYDRTGLILELNLKI